LHSKIGRFLHRLHGEIFGRLHDDRPLATDPGDDRRPVFVVVPPTGLALLAATTRSAAQMFFPALLRLPLLASGVIEFIRFHGAHQLGVPAVMEQKTSILYKRLYLLKNYRHLPSCF
jgi:hypothetical protein